MTATNIRKKQVQTYKEKSSSLILASDGSLQDMKKITPASIKSIVEQECSTPVPEATKDFMGPRIFLSSFDLRYSGTATTRLIEVEEHLTTSQEEAIAKEAMQTVEWNKRCKAILDPVLMLLEVAGVPLKRAVLYLQRQAKRYRPQDFSLARADLESAYPIINDLTKERDPDAKDPDSYAIDESADQEENFVQDGD